ncbi:MAG: ATP synthase subunit delta [candidate division TM6 bacterium GW2011_GWF2_28_16]|nr:MAG: ATP synthase subunit delta [candidate division TM6 bacterium GW2011_GWF2_28_16]
MQVEIDLITKKYASAFLNVFSDQIKDNNLSGWIKLKNFLSKNKFFYIYLHIPTISHLTKQKALIRVAQALDLQKPIIKMMFVLLEHNRIEMLDKVLNNIIILYRQKINTKLFKVTSPYNLNEFEQKIILDFTKSIAKCNVDAEFIIDKKLIAGLRIQSLTFLWERSVAKQLRGIKRSVFKQVGLW